MRRNELVDALRGKYPLQAEGVTPLDSVALLAVDRGILSLMCVPDTAELTREHLLGVVQGVIGHYEGMRHRVPEAVLSELEEQQKRVVADVQAMIDAAD